MLRFLGLGVRASVRDCPWSALGACRRYAAPAMDTMIAEEAATQLRNVAIVAHVDHGKTTMIDRVLAQCQDGFAGAERAMDSLDLEKERGITIMSKVTSVTWGDHRLNIVDTPGHADFGGEVERVLSMVDGVVLLVDATEGVMAQTKFVVRKALKQGLPAVVVLNKVDRPTARPDVVHSEVFDLFAALDATDEQLDFTMLYASGKEGWAVEEVDGPRERGMAPLLEKIVECIPPPIINREDKFAMVANMMSYDNFIGRKLLGRVMSGSVAVGDRIHALTQDGTVRQDGKVAKILAPRGIEMVQLDRAEAGDIVQIAGLTDAFVSDTLASPEVTEPLPANAIDPPTISVTVYPNNSPLQGQDGKKLTSQVIRERLWKETQNNVSINVQPAKNSGEATELFARGELQIGVLIEEMRREGFEMALGRPQVVFQKDKQGKRLEPIEELTVEVDDGDSGTVMERLSARKGDLVEMGPAPEPGRTMLRYHVPSRGVFGYRSQFLTDTKGTGVMTQAFLEYAPHKGSMGQVRKGVLVSMDSGKTNNYALEMLEPRGTLFYGNGQAVYPGMIVGENSKQEDIAVNPTKAKKLDNMRSANNDDIVRLAPPKSFTLEEAIGYITDDELVEVTPTSVRMRKIEPDADKRRKILKAQKAAGDI